MGYFVGLDLGQSQDYTALAVVQTIPSNAVDGTPVEPSELHVRHIERFPLGTPYPAIVAAVAKHLPSIPTDPHDGRRPVLVVDKTGVGAPVVNMFQDAGLEPVAITITSGASPTRADDGCHVPKRDLISTLQVIFQNHRLKVNPDLPASAFLTKELLNFKVNITTSGNTTYEAWRREGTHDDLVLAVALAAWVAENPQYFQQRGPVALPRITGVAIPKRQQRDHLW